MACVANRKAISVNMEVADNPICGPKRAAEAMDMLAHRWTWGSGCGGGGTGRDLDRPSYNAVGPGTAVDPASLLELEITERLLVEDNPNTSRMLEDIKQTGVRLSLDDFGKGYSSLSYLKRFPFDVLKIDRAFISGVTTDPEDAALCRAITAMASSLNLSIVAEGVETKEQWDFLETHGADLAQGYYVSRPLSAEGFDAFLTTCDKQERNNP